MPKLLTRLRIDEVSAVDRGAGENVKIVLMKRASRPDATPADTLRAFPNPRSFNAVYARMAAEAAIAKSLADDERGDDGGGDVDVTKAHEHRGHHELAASLVQHLHDALERRREAHGYQKSAKETPMSHNELVRSVIKQYGLTSFCKSMISDEKSYGVSEHDLVDLISEEAQVAFPSLSKAQAFEKFYTEASERGVTLRKAVAIAKDATFAEVVLGPGFAPQVVGGADAQNVDDPAEAVAQLKQLGARKWPTASEADQFERALCDPMNHKLARRAVPLPQATTNYPFPR
jgi:hypothetical protein